MSVCICELQVMDDNAFTRFSETKDHFPVVPKQWESDPYSDLGLSDLEEILAMKGMITSHQTIRTTIRGGRKLGPSQTAHKLDKCRQFQ